MKTAARRGCPPLLAAAVVVVACVLLAVARRSPAAAEVAPAAPQWTPERANAWYARQPWPCGFNYLPATAINSTEMWAADTFDPSRIGREFDEAQRVGFNCARVFVQYLVWEQDRDGLHGRMDRFLTIAADHGIRVVFVPFDDCYFGHQGPEPIPGRQPDPTPGEYASGFTSSPGPRRVDDPRYWPQLRGYVADLLTWFGHDRRVFCWDLYNECGNSGQGRESYPLLRAEWAWAREVNPDQPLTMCHWNDDRELNAFIDGHADVVTFHNYDPAASMREQIATLKRLARPVICTEWLNRPRGSTVADVLPVLAAERVGAIHWGLVNGKTQTNYPWGSTAGSPPPKLWQHDLWHTDLTPYDPAELARFHDTIARVNGK